MKRTEVFERDGWRCVYCGNVYDAEHLSVDHVQPKVRGGDNSGGNVVTACTTCNTAKGATPLAQFLAASESARGNFFALARYVWPRHLRAVAEELARRGVVGARPVSVEETGRLRGSEAIADADGHDVDVDVNAKM